MREFRTSGSVGALGGQPPRATQRDHRRRRHESPVGTTEGQTREAWFGGQCPPCTGRKWPSAMEVTQ